MKQCLLCLDYSKENICPACKVDLPWVKSTCPGCGRHSEPSKLCAICQHQPSFWNLGRAPLVYAPPITGLITQLKFSRVFYQARTLTELFLEGLPQNTLPELLLPVPLHPWRLLSRGFNQSTELCKCLSTALHIPYDPYYLKRNKHSLHQSGSNKKIRKSNVAQAFALLHPLPVSRIALVDDVLTTGETLGQICQAIRAVQPQITIEVWAMAQTLLRS